MSARYSVTRRGFVFPSWEAYDHRERMVRAVFRGWRGRRLALFAVHTIGRMHL